MGYSVGVHFPDSETTDRVFGFLRENLKPASDLLPGMRSWGDCGLLKNELPYDPGENKVGFNYSILDHGHDFYLYSVCRWMALRGGLKKSEFHLNGSDFVFSERVPYLVYDGMEYWPVVPEGQADLLPHPDLKWTLVDESGMKIHKGSFERGLIQFLRNRGGLKAIQEEMRRLSDLWREYERVQVSARS